MRITTSFMVLCLLSTLFISCAQNKLDANAIHEKALTIDTHCDTPMRFTRSSFDIGEEHQAPKSRVDLPRMKKGGLDAIFFAIFTIQRERTPANYEEAYHLAHQMIDSTQKAVAQHKELASLAVNASDAVSIAKQGKRAIYLGMENGFPLGKDITRVEEFYKRGVRYITLAHTKNNDICDSSTDKKGAEHNGLSSFGKQVVNEMNRLGMLIDVSHISDKAFYDVLEESEVPVFASHSSVRSVCDHARNMDDAMIKALAKNGGVIQICILGSYIHPEDTTSENYLQKEALRLKYNNWNYTSDEQRKQAWGEWRGLNEKYPPVLPTIADAVDHIDYVVNLVGVDYVGIGSDFDGGGGLKDCVDVADFPKITQELVKRGYSEEDIVKIWGGNFIRVYNAAEAAVKS